MRRVKYTDQLESVIFRKLRIISVILDDPYKLRFITDDTTLRAARFHDFSQLRKMRIATSLPNIYSSTRKWSRQCCPYDSSKLAVDRERPSDASD